jgi:molecular chaperone GrpE
MEEENKEKNKEGKEKASQKLEYIEEEGEKVLNFERKIKKLKKELKNCQKEKEEYLSGWQRERADFINYKKNEEKRLEEKALFLKKNILLEILSILDNIERAEGNLPEEIKNHPWVEGILKIKDQIKDLLKKEDVEEIKIGEDFNPEFCEAVEMVDGEEGKIMEVLQKGYLLKSRVLRPARVKVGKKSVNKEQKAEDI